MTPLARLGHLVPRLLLGVAVIMCVMGLAEAGAAAGESPKAGPVVASAPQDAGAHGSAHAAAAQPEAAPERPDPGGGHGGHGSDPSGGHALSCMVTAGLSVAAFALPQLVGEGTALVAPPTRRMMSELPPELLPRPPDLLRALCVQRT